MMLRHLGVAVALSATVPVLSQVPAHAVLLNPTLGLQDFCLARAGGVVHAFGVTMLPIPGFVHYARSEDGGRTFPTIERPLAYMGTVLGVGGVLGGAAVDGDEVHAVVNAAWVGPHVISSHDGGVTWLVPVRVSQRSNVFAVPRPAVHVHGQDVTVVWPELTSAGYMWSNHSGNGGSTWQAADTRLDAGLSNGGYASPQIVAIGSDLHVFWTHQSQPAQAVHQVSRDGGGSWLATPQVIGSMMLRRAAGSAAVLVVSDDSGAGMLRSVDGGVTWLSTVVPGIHQVQSLAVHGTTILVVGTLPQPLPSAVLLQVSTDAGATWLPVPYSVGYYRNAVISAQAAAHALLVHFRFDSSLDPTSAIIQSDDAGVGWRLVTGDAEIGMLVGDDGVLALGRTTYGGSDVRLWSLEGHTRHGYGDVGTGAIEPRLTARGLAGLGRTFGLEVSSARGGALGAVFGSCEPLGAAPLGGSTLFLQQPIVTAMFTASGSSGAPGSGAATVAVTVPFTAALAGQRLASQAFVVDPASPWGFVATAAVESWLF